MLPLGPILKSLRLKHGLSQEQLSKKANIGRNTIIRMEKQVYYVTLANLVRIGNVLEIPAWKILKYAQVHDNDGIDQD
jgi:transcriptional regulator with XRE-family HTH domain